MCRLPRNGTVQGGSEGQRLSEPPNRTAQQITIDSLPGVFGVAVHRADLVAAIVQFQRLAVDRRQGARAEMVDLDQDQCLAFRIVYSGNLHIADPCRVELALVTVLRSERAILVGNENVLIAVRAQTRWCVWNTLAQSRKSMRGE